jgi:hypothetical protein
MRREAEERMAADLFYSAFLSPSALLRLIGFL